MVGAKYLRDIAVVFLILILIAIGALWLAADAQSVTGKKFTVTFRFEQGNVLEPETRIYVLVDADNEGSAAIKAFKHLSEKLTVQACEKLKFQEAQQKQ
jgi:hypothetical protein